MQTEIIQKSTSKASKHKIYVHMCARSMGGRVCAAAKKKNGCTDVYLVVVSG